VFTRVHQWTLSWARWIHSKPCFFNILLVLTSHLCMGLPSGFYHSGFLTNFLCIAHLSHVCYSPTWNCHMYIFLLVWRRRHINESVLIKFWVIIVFENKVLRIIFVSKRDREKGGWRELYNGDLHNC
jgi:hypothetical protein